MALRVDQLPRFGYAFAFARAVEQRKEAMMHMQKSSAAEIVAQNHKLSRREFARRAALAATTAVVVPATLLSQETATRPTPAPDKPPQTTTELSPELLAEGELKYQWIIQKYGSRLTDAEKQDIHRLVMEAQKPLAAFRAFPLDNPDQPATVLKFSDAAIFGEGSCG